VTPCDSAHKQQAFLTSLINKLYRLIGSVHKRKSHIFYMHRVGNEVVGNLWSPSQFCTIKNADLWLYFRAYLLIC